MAARVRQIQLWLVPDSPAGDARRSRVRLRPDGVREHCAVERPGAVLRRRDRAGIRAGVAIVAVLRGADSQAEGAVSVLTITSLDTTSGSVMTNAQPLPGRLRMVMSPPCARTDLRAIE